MHSKVMPNFRFLAAPSTLTTARTLSSDKKCQPKAPKPCHTVCPPTPILKRRLTCQNCVDSALALSCEWAPDVCLQDRQGGWRGQEGLNSSGTCIWVAQLLHRNETFQQSTITLLPEWKPYCLFKTQPQSLGYISRLEGSSDLLKSNAQRVPPQMARKDSSP